MADVLDQLQEQEDLIHRLHIQAVRQQLSVKGESLTRCECCGNRIQERRQKAIPGVRTCTECQRVLEIREKIIRGEGWKAEKPIYYFCVISAT
ncbi:conjugal transfer protein TraR [Salmonella enterica]|nr:conjugal transfer protein TraR [Salmonella enterica]EDY0938059.1 conjugal transfer protein TraR [Salmonella enterica subsp. enterica serovar Florida]ELA1691585.1 TraR/DksA C4-type zinc finger protein [Klebsiella aerogenes]EAO2615886.1 conjugal transfer protein TraR [Salmonella enterica]EAQ3272747.1 conjugal transfer protein TraR [Salmonella enterica]